MKLFIKFEFFIKFITEFIIEVHNLNLLEFKRLKILINTLLLKIYHESLGIKDTYTKY